jgi:hypothetical protein
VTVYQNARNIEILIKAVSSGTPVIGLIAEDFTIQKWKPGIEELELIPLLEEEIIEISDGYYILKFTEDDTLWNTLGEHFMKITGSFDTIEKTVDVIIPPINGEVLPEKCIISGNVMDLGGNPAINKTVSFRPVDFPVSYAGVSVLTSDRINTTPDVYGNFSVALLRGQTVLVEIEHTGIKNQIIIPEQPSAVLLDLLPPIL